MITQLERKALVQSHLCLDEARSASYLWTWQKALKDKLDLLDNAILKSCIEAELKKIQQQIGEAENWLNAVIAKEDK